MAVNLLKLIAGDLGKDWFNKFNANVDAETAASTARDAQVTSLQTTITALLSRIAFLPTSGSVYSPPTDTSGFLYGAAPAVWTKCVSNGSPLLIAGAVGSDTATANNTAQPTPFPTVTVMPWSYGAKSMLVGYTVAGTYAGGPSGGTGTSYANMRRVALDANGAPTITSADAAVPAASGTGTNAMIPLVSGAATSDSTFKAFGFDYAPLLASPANFSNFAFNKRSVSWDGTTVTVSTDGSLVFANAGNSNTNAPPFSLAYSINQGAQLCGLNGINVPGLIGYDLTTYDQGAGIGYSFGNYRCGSFGSKTNHDFAGSGRVVVPYVTTTVSDPTNRLTIAVERRDDISGVTSSASYRFAQKTIGSTAPVIVCLSSNLFLVQFLDASGLRWAAVLTYNPTTNVLALWGNIFYQGGNLGSQPFAYPILYSPTVMASVRKDTATQAAKIMLASFNSAAASGQELVSATANDVAFTLLGSVTGITFVSIQGAFKISSDTLIVYGRVTIQTTVMGVTTSAMSYYVEAFTLL